MNLPLSQPFPNYFPLIAFHKHSPTCQSIKPSIPSKQSPKSQHQYHQPHLNSLLEMEVLELRAALGNIQRSFHTNGLHPWHPSPNSPASIHFLTNQTPTHPPVSNAEVYQFLKELEHARKDPRHAKQPHKEDGMQDLMTVEYEVCVCVCVRLLWLQMICVLNVVTSHFQSKTGTKIPLPNTRRTPNTQPHHILPLPNRVIPINKRRETHAPKLTAYIHCPIEHRKLSPGLITYTHLPKL